jgi:hypothetical protein
VENHAGSVGSLLLVFFKKNIYAGIADILAYTVDAIAVKL